MITTTENSNIPDMLDDFPVLSEHAKRALNEFLSEQQEVFNIDSANQHKSDYDFSVSRNVSENWQLSQFWYDEKTAKILAQECVGSCGISGKIACVSSPTAFAQILADFGRPATNVVLLEFDKRFQEVYHDRFVFYDYNAPLSLPGRLKK